MAKMDDGIYSIYLFWNGNQFREFVLTGYSLPSIRPDRAHLLEV